MSLNCSAAAAGSVFLTGRNPSWSVKLLHLHSASLRHCSCCLVPVEDGSCLISLYWAASTRPEAAFLCFWHSLEFYASGQLELQKRCWSFSQFLYACVNGVNLSWQFCPVDSVVALYPSIKPITNVTWRLLLSRMMLHSFAKDASQLDINAEPF